MTERETERYQRNLLVEGFSATGQQRLSESRVTVVGAGGLGSATLNYLAAAGVGRLRIVENDTVSLSNARFSTRPPTWTPRKRKSPRHGCRG